MMDGFEGEVKIGEDEINSRRSAQGRMVLWKDAAFFHLRLLDLDLNEQSESSIYIFLTSEVNNRLRLPAKCQLTGESTSRIM